MSPASCRPPRFGRRARCPCRPRHGRRGPAAAGEAKRLRRDDTHRPVSVKSLALQLPQDSWQTIAWREGTNETLCGRFARCRVRPAHRDDLREAVRPQEWRLVEWPQGEAEPTKYWLSTLPEEVSFERLADLTNPRIKSGGRWRIERDYQELKRGRSGWDITRGEGGAASTITPRCASPPTASWSPRGRRFPPQDLVPPGGSRGSRNLPFPTVTDPEVPPIRPERHIPNSIATMRRRLTVALAGSLQRCPCCNAPRKPPNPYPHL
jgi:hypothetical protein